MGQSLEARNDLLTDNPEEVGSSILQLQGAEFYQEPEGTGKQILPLEPSAKTQPSRHPHFSLQDPKQRTQLTLDQ